MTLSTTRVPRASSVIHEDLPKLQMLVMRNVLMLTIDVRLNSDYLRARDKEVYHIVFG